MAREEYTFKDYYEVLHLHPEADAAMVDQAYWHLARLYNAAIPTDSDARPMLEELNEAYSVLRTSELRGEYDALRDAVLGVGALPETRTPTAEPPPLSVMQKQKTKAKDARQFLTEPAVDEQPTDEAPADRRARFGFQFDLKQVSVPNWQGVMVLASLLLLGGAAITAGAEPALVLFALVVGIGFTVIAIVARGPRFPRLPRPQVALPTIGASRLAERHPRSAVDSDTLRVQTEAMLARWREAASTMGDGSSEPVNHPAPDRFESRQPEAPPPPRQAGDTQTERLRESLRRSTEAIRARAAHDTSDSE